MRAGRVVAWIAASIALTCAAALVSPKAANHPTPDGGETKQILWDISSIDGYAIPTSATAYLIEKHSLVSRAVECDFVSYTTDYVRGAGPNIIRAWTVGRVKGRLAREDDLTAICRGRGGGLCCSALRFLPHESIGITGLWVELKKKSNIDSESWRPAGVNEIKCYRDFSGLVLYIQRTGNGRVWRHPSSLFHMHLVQLTLHRMLLPQKVISTKGSDDYGGYIEPKPTTLPPAATFVMGYLLLSIAVGMVIYSMQRGDYLLPVGVLLAFLPFALGLSLVLEGTCPPFLAGLYSTLPVCRYAVPYGVP